MRDTAYKSTATPADGLTEKAQRVSNKASILRGHLDQICARTTKPIPTNEKMAEGRPPEPSHAVFALESAEQSLDEAIKTAEFTLSQL